DGERLSRLSRRERQIFELVADGWTTRAIAESLGITPRTVEVHRHNVVAKLEVPNTAALIKLAIRTGVTRI
ncbi:MAG TPA: LuxR family transcriptional regulator, partial [Planctomycetes bacterium]|nr:LuxR family transcriptional regulator [Planctomycetota bacterium]